MKRFYSSVDIAPRTGGWQVMLDERPIRTQQGGQQIVPTRALARLLAAEWQVQGDEIDPRGFVFRDLADFAIDQVARDRISHIATLTTFAQTDTLCYRADPDEPLYHRQLEVWEPLLSRCEARHAITFHRISGIMHRPQETRTLAVLQARIGREDEFTLAALTTLASLASSLIVALAVLEEETDPAALFSAANCEEDWQADLWGWDEQAQQRRTLRLEAFEKTAQFLKTGTTPD